MLDGHRVDLGSAVKNPRIAVWTGVARDTGPKPVATFILAWRRKLTDGRAAESQLRILQPVFFKEVSRAARSNRQITITTGGFDIVTMFLL